MNQAGMNGLKIFLLALLTIGIGPIILYHFFPNALRIKLDFKK